MYSFCYVYVFYCYVRSVYCSIVLFCALFVCKCVLYCTVLLPAGVNPIAVNTYIKSYHNSLPVDTELTSKNIAVRTSDGALSQYHA
jgi:hypothetical protein